MSEIPLGGLMAIGDPTSPQKAWTFGPRHMRHHTPRAESHALPFTMAGSAGGIPAPLSGEKKNPRASFELWENSNSGCLFAFVFVFWLTLALEVLEVLNLPGEALLETPGSWLLTIAWNPNEG